MTFMTRLPSHDSRTLFRGLAESGGYLSIVHARVMILDGSPSSPSVAASGGLNTAADSGESAKRQWCERLTVLPAMAAHRIGPAKYLRHSQISIYDLSPDLRLHDLRKQFIVPASKPQAMQIILKQTSDKGKFRVRI